MKVNRGKGENGAMNTGDADLTFRQWLAQLESYILPPSPWGLAVAFVVLIITATLSTFAIEWLLPQSTLEDWVHRISGLPPVLLALGGGMWAMFSVILVAPDGGWNAIRALPMILVSAAFIEAGIGGGFALADIIAEDNKTRFLLALPVIIIVVPLGIAIMLGTAYRFRPPAPVSRPPRRDSQAMTARTLIVVPASLAAAILFTFIDLWISPADCSVPLGAAGLGMFTVLFGGHDVVDGWQRAGAQRGALLRRWGAMFLIGLAALPVGRLFGCGTLTDSDLMGWQTVLIMLGGYALPVYLTAAWLASWQMDRFLSRHRLRRQDMMEPA